MQIIYKKFVFYVLRSKQGDVEIFLGLQAYVCRIMAAISSVVATAKGGLRECVIHRATLCYNEMNSKCTVRCRKRKGGTESLFQ